MKTLLLSLIVAAAALAQTPQYAPQYVVGTGVSYDYYGKTGFAGGTTFAARVTSPTTSTTLLYSYTTLDLTPQTASLRTGAAYTFYNQGNWSLTALGQAGLTTGTGVTLGQFSGGGFLAYDIGARLTGGSSHFYVSVGGSILNVTSQTVQPILVIGFGKGF